VEVKREKEREFSFPQKSRGGREKRKRERIFFFSKKRIVGKKRYIIY
jgi:hypothetical protein